MCRLSDCSAAREPSSCAEQNSCLAWGRGLWVKLGEGCGCTARGWVVGTAWGGVVAWPKYHTHIHTCTHTHLCTHAHTRTHTHTHTHVCTRTHVLKLLPYYSGLNHHHKYCTTMASGPVQELLCTSSCNVSLRQHVQFSSIASSPETPSSPSSNGQGMVESRKN